MLNASEKEKLSGYEALQEKLDKQFGGHVDMAMVIGAFLEYDAQIRDDKDLADAIMLTNGSAVKYRRWKKLEEEGRLVEVPCRIGDTVRIKGASPEEAEVTRFTHSMEDGFCAIAVNGGGKHCIPFAGFGEMASIVEDAGDAGDAGEAEE
ncbi:MAG: hypothetical protein NC489_41655 [Ruminococcus flavefaciens]|nr:hypothetical protein [Ruminococcus flavefaciens]